MTLSEIEIQERVAFKMNEAITALENTHNTYFSLAVMNPNQKNTHFSEAFKIAADIVRKERDLPTPTDNMANEKLREIRDKTIDMLYKRLIKVGDRNRNNDERFIANTIITLMEKLTQKHI